MTVNGAPVRCSAPILPRHQRLLLHSRLLSSCVAVAQRRLGIGEHVYVIPSQQHFRTIPAELCRNASICLLTTALVQLLSADEISLFSVHTVH